MLYVHSLGKSLIVPGVLHHAGSSTSPYFWTVEDGRGGTEERSGYIYWIIRSLMYGSLFEAQDGRIEKAERIHARVVQMHLVNSNLALEGGIILAQRF